MKKAYLILFLVFALVLSGWTFTPALGSPAQLRPDQKVNDCKGGTDMLRGNLAAQQNVIRRARQICEFDIRMGQLNSRVSDLDRRFIVSAIAGNMLEIQSLNYALERAENEEWRGLIQMMIAQHTHDLDMAIKIAKRLNINTSPDLTNLRVYPGTPDYDLGMRRVNLVAKFLDPLMSAGTSITPTVTAVPTGITGTPTGIPTTGITDTPTAIATLDTATPLVTSTADLTGTATGIVPLDTPTASATPMAGVTDTATMVPPSQTPTPSATTIVDLTGTPTAVPTMQTGTPTLVPTLVPGGAAVNFDLVSLTIIEDEHAMLIQTALAAERLVHNDEIRAFAKHSADMAQMHVLLINDLQQRLLGLTVLAPPPTFQREYQGPRRFGPDGDD